MKATVTGGIVLLAVMFLLSAGGLSGQTMEKKFAPNASPSQPALTILRAAPDVGPSGGSAYAGDAIPLQQVIHSSREAREINTPPVVNQRVNSPLYGYDPAHINEYGSLNVNAKLAGLGDSSSYVSVPSSGYFGNSIDGSIEMWINPSTFTGNTQEFMSKGSTTTPQFLFGMNPFRRLFFRIGISADNNNTGDSILTGIWTHVAVTWDGGGPYIVKFYVDGKQSGKTDTLNATWVDNTEPLKIGAASNPAWRTEAFQGAIDEVRWWNPARTEAEIRENRFVGLGDAAGADLGLALTSSASYIGLLASWTFNGNYGGTVYDDISGLNGTLVGNANAYLADAGVPMPYNLALHLQGNDSANVVVPYNSLFEQNVDGSCEMWISPNSFLTAPVFMSKGKTANSSFAWGANSDSMQFFRIGTTIYHDTTKLLPLKWQHIAVTWSGGPNFTVRFYVNGKLKTASTASATWNLNTDSVIIGGIQVPGWTYEGYNGYMDEVRFWGTLRSAADIQKYMFVSGRSMLPDTKLIGLWNFDGSLNNYSAVTGINGTFHNGKRNTGRLSGYRNETSSGSYYTMYPRSHSTVINWYYGGGASPFPGSFTQDAPFVTIPDDDTVGVSRTITIAGPTGPVTSVQAFLSIEHTYLGDLTVSLKAPNGTVVNLLDGNAGGNENVLSFFADNFSYLPTSTVYNPPWAYLKPITAFGTFGGSNMQGVWTLKAVDDANGDIGILKGWGLRFNNLVLGVDEAVQDLPGQFALYQNYPNPFNPTTTITYTLPGAAKVSVAVYNILGQQVASLVNETMPAGTHKAVFEASRLAPGTYFYRITAGSFVETKKMLLLK